MWPVSGSLPDAKFAVRTPRGVAAEFGDAVADAAGRVDYLAALELRVASLADTAEWLRRVPGVEVQADRVVVPADAAFNTTLAFAA